MRKTVRNLGLFLILSAGSASWAAGIEWGACPPPPSGIPGAGQECATLQVPLDYRAPRGRQIELAISRLRSARPDLRRGVLLMNPGGPGEPGRDLPRLAAASFPERVLDRYDLIGFDPRFVGLSTPVSCGLTPEEALQVDFPLEQPGGFSATAAWVREVASRCHSKSGGVLRFATTANTARDMDRIRRALGESKISYLGVSYGTYLGAVYASLFPTRTDRVVLDSAVDPQWVWRDQFRSFGPGGELRFLDFANFAAANDAVYHLGDTPEEIRRLFLDTVARLNADPVRLEDGTIVTSGLFRAAVFGSLYSDDSFPELAALWRDFIESIANDDAAAALEKLVHFRRPELAVAVPRDNETAAGLAIVCDDVAWPRLVREYRQDFRRDSARYPLFGPLGSNIWPCAFWHGEPVEPPVSITPRGPSNILILQNLRDPATPWEGALGMRRALGRRSRLVSVDQGGHGVYVQTPNACGNEVVTAFLAEGILPGEDVACPATASAKLIPAAGSARERAVEEWMRRLRW